jgi:ABC-type transport system involved in cytochrome bd biosynthesis fused ATPase/permease subunit
MRPAAGRWLRERVKQVAASLQTTMTDPGDNRREHPATPARAHHQALPAVVANSDVSLTVQPGETHAVLGENGAGKSTLMKIIYGAVKPDEGSVLFNGQPVHIRNPQEARALGISMVFQHFSLFDTLTVAENVWLGLDKSQPEPGDAQHQRQGARSTGWTSIPRGRCTRCRWARCSGWRSSARCSPTPSC